MAEAKAKQDNADPEQDQSMEEILQSIRRIIAEENDDAKETPAAVMTATEFSGREIKPEPTIPAAAKGSDVLELTDMVKEDGSIINIKGEQATKDVAAKPKAPADPAPSGDVLSDIDKALSPNAPTAKPAAPPAKNDEDLISSEASKAASAALKTLTGTAPPQTAPAKPVDVVNFRSGTTVEDLVLEALRPMLKSWLDSNLPTIVERLVTKEVKKIASGSQD